jgi:hypothetical protein
MKLQLTRDQLSLVYAFGDTVKDEHGGSYYRLPYIVRTLHDSNIVELISEDKLPSDVADKFKKK